MTKQDLVNEIAKSTGIEKTVVLKVVDSFMETTISSMEKGSDIFLRGFGTFLIKKRAKKTARNISKNTAFIIPEHNIPKFKPCKEFVDAVKKDVKS